MTALVSTVAVFPAVAGSASISATACVQRSGTLHGAPSRALLSLVGVLRRPATPADALPAQVLNDYTTPPSGIQIFVKYVRLARVVAGTAFYVIPERVTRCLSSVKPYDSVDLYALGIGGGGGGIVRPDHLLAGFTRGRSVPPHITLYAIAPDGVATITLHYPAGRAGGFSHEMLPAFTTTTRVVNNIVDVIVPRAGERARSSMTMTWRAANGTVIRTFHTL